MASDKVRVGVIGLRIGQAHIKGYNKVPQCEVVALCDLDESRAVATQRDCELGKAQIFTDYRAMLEDAELDAVSVCLPNYLHCPVAVDCLDAGTHIICEKPLATSAGDAALIAEAAVRNGKKCMVSQVNRFRPDSIYLKRLIESGELGRVYYAHTGWLRKRGIPGYGGWFTTKEQSGGGPLIDIGVHLLDIAWWLCGCPAPISATGATYAEFGPRGKGLGGWGQKAKGNFDVEDLAVGFLRFENGLTINLEVSWAIHNERDRQWCQIFGSEGGCDWGNEPALYREVLDAPLNARLDVGKGDPWQGAMQHFIDCILNDTTPDPDANQGVTMMKMLDAIYQSAATKREVIIR
jgi:predicted dehydrogenase